VQGTDFDEEAFFSAIDASGAGALLIGRRALVALGLPVLTGDYHFWVHADDIEVFNEASGPFGLVPNQTPEGARRRGRYVLENDEHVDVLVAGTLSVPGGTAITIEEAWDARQRVAIGAAAALVPSVPDLIRLKRIGGRARDLEDIRWLEELERNR
jgi:hypothetical protein